MRRRSFVTGALVLTQLTAEILIAVQRPMTRRRAVATLLRGATDTLVRVNLRNGTIKSLKQPQVVYETTKPERKTAEPYSYSITYS